MSHIPRSPAGFTITAIIENQVFTLTESLTHHHINLQDVVYTTLTFYW